MSTYASVQDSTESHLLVIRGVVQTLKRGVIGLQLVKTPLASKLALQKKWFSPSGRRIERSESLMNLIEA